MLTKSVRNRDGIAIFYTQGRQWRRYNRDGQDFFFWYKLPIYCQKAELIRLSATKHILRPVLLKIKFILATELIILFIKIFFCSTIIYQIIVSAEGYCCV